MPRLTAAVASVAILACLALPGRSATAEDVPPPIPGSAILWRTFLGGGPQAVTVDEASGEIYVANATTHEVVTVTAEGTIEGAVKIPGREERFGPLTIAFNPGPKQLITSDANGDLALIDVNSRTVAAVREFRDFSAYARFIDPSRGQLFATSAFGSGGRVLVLDGATLETKNIYDVPGTSMDGLALDGESETLYIANQPLASITKLNLDTCETQEIASGFVDGPYAMAFDPRSEDIYAAARSVSLVYVIDTRDNSVVTTIAGKHFGSWPWVALDASHQRLYVLGNYVLALIDTEARTLVFERSVGATSAGFALDSSRRRLYVLDGRELVAIDAAQLEDTAQFPVMGGRPGPGSSPAPVVAGALLLAAGVALFSAALRPVRH